MRIRRMLVATPRGGAAWLGDPFQTGVRTCDVKTDYDVVYKMRILRQKLVKRALQWA